MQKQCADFLSWLQFIVKRERGVRDQEEEAAFCPALNLKAHREPGS